MYLCLKKKMLCGDDHSPTMLVGVSSLRLYCILIFYPPKEKVMPN